MEVYEVTLNPGYRLCCWESIRVFLWRVYREEAHDNVWCSHHACWNGELLLDP